MNTSIIKCPTCNAKTMIDNKTLKCENNHSFDLAKQGYINLLINKGSKTKIHGDSKEMLNARKLILEKGYYQTISNNLNNIINSFGKNNRIIDIGSGVGYYLDNLEKSNQKNEYYGIDISKDGIKEASKANKAISYIVGTNNQLPFLDNSADIIYSIFSPINIDECVRVLKGKGHLITVSPNQNHLGELKKLVYEVIIEKDYLVNDIVYEGIKKVDSIIIKEEITLNDFDLYQLFMMTPHYFKTPIIVKDKIKNIEKMTLTIDVVVNVYQYLL
ncbi:hypothetical protein CI105_07070 [Candidatus Izimaplasma bacterium ZiA1]|uniref:putative RNA methyltransferase n=1 Tax=Candidatus Izimoplasma sp. ZiA1 TaxID=2024899 RepID=UPI000BAA7122|nr:hypothetical protein CI105_07070 [Candidatus Izimaplasma bacterium ZiA1]